MLDILGVSDRISVGIGRLFKGAMKEKSFKKAQKIWMALSTDVKRKILSNVWCGQCTTSVTICDYSMTMDSGVLVLRGFCST